MGSGMLGKSDGFTLLELVVVLLIMALVIGTSMPRISAGWRHLEEREFMQEFSRTVRRARLQAMEEGGVAVFRIRPKDRTYGLENPPESPIPANVDIYSDQLREDSATGDGILIFYPDGSPSASEIDVTFDHDRVFYLNIHPLTGTVAWMRATKE